MRASGEVRSGIARFLRRVASMFRRDREESRPEREIASHLGLLEEQYRRRGMSGDDARRAARIALGGVEQIKEQHRDTRAFRWLDDVQRDVSYALRMLRRYPIATVTAALSLALGVGINAAVFSIVDWVLLRPLPYSNARELVHVLSTATSPVSGPGPLTYSEFETFANATAFSRAAAFTTATRVIGGAAIDPAHVVVARVAGDLFGTLGVTAEIGRTFTRQEMAAGAPVVVLSYDLWKRRFAGIRSIEGRTVTIDGAPHVVIGVTPSGRGYPAGAELWRPLQASEREDDDRELSMVARLRTGTTTERASAELATLARASTNQTRTAWADDVQRRDFGNVSAALRALFAAAMLTLLIACANVAALIGARGADRAGEVAVRGALGATRSRVFGQLIVESLVLATIGGALGLLVGNWALTSLISLAPWTIPRLAEISLDGRILVIGFGATALTGVIVGLVPALRLSRFTESSPLNRHGGYRVTGRTSGRRALVLAQVSIAVLLTCGAGLLTRSLQRLVSLDHGFAPERLVAADLYLRGVFDGDARQLIRELIAQSESIPGVEAVAWSMRLPTQVPGLRTSIAIVGGPKIAPPATLRVVTDTYFETVGLPIREGRQFTSLDQQHAPRVAIVNSTFVRDMLGGRPPLGTVITTSIAEQPVRIVGVVADVTPAGEPDRPAVYVPFEQLSVAGGSIIVRAKGDPRSIILALANRLGTTVPGLAFDRVHRVAEDLEASRGVVRFTTQVSATFAGLALLLSVVGIYGLTAGDVAARWRELAVRLALGATRREAVWTVIRPSAHVLAAGAGIGVAGAVSISPALGSLLHGIGPADLTTFVVAPLLLAMVGLLAAWLAARRVIRVDPAVALRSE
jgi:putative ABC transport system permease protein